MGYTPHVVVIGGGLVGTATARDLSMRGLEVTLVERGTLAGGATGGAFGLLDSGTRFAGSYPEMARRCYEEDETLRQIASHCMEETGGLFVKYKGDDGSYEKLREAASEAGIPVEEFSGEEIREREPALSDGVEGGFEVSTANVDPFRLTTATARSAREYGATVRTRTKVTELLVEEGAVRGVKVETPEGKTETIRSQYVVNAAGHSVGEVASTAGIELSTEQSSRAAIVMDGRPTERTVIRVAPQSKNDWVVPQGSTTTLGVANWEGSTELGKVREHVDRILNGLTEVLPTVEEGRFLRAQVSVHSELTDSGDQNDEESGGKNMASMTVVDHEQRDDIWGLSTVLGGTVGTHRLVAENVSDQVCKKFGIDRPSQTATTPLPGSGTAPTKEDLQAELDLNDAVLEASVRRLGDRAGEVLDTDGPNPVVCTCEGVTRAEVKYALSDETAQSTDLEAVSVRTGAGKGPCQGGRCAHRLGSPLYLKTDKGSIEREIENFYQNRWDEQRPVLWGEQLGQAMENYALHATTMSRDEQPSDVDLEAFDSGPAWDDDEVDPYGGFAP